MPITRSQLPCELRDRIYEYFLINAEVIAIYFINDPEGMRILENLSQHPLTRTCKLPREERLSVYQGGLTILTSTTTLRMGIGSVNRASIKRLMLIIRVDKYNPNQPGGASKLLEAAGIEFYKPLVRVISNGCYVLPDIKGLAHEVKPIP
ncbi:hypothetical protein LTR16_002817 [Cryomyces antarcticus]|uniref:Uncharacterized protein n=1 Tax=Cryomyces antarcticus TaxID=329879 RepID=A0ABR0KT21_9PEZI|nr:hypothetical protein LTR60_001686 [Cryomyces antarcticus]KAK5127667.1 hypothetical protein LTR16_002817 [Cryomyces antarcticus]